MLQLLKREKDDRKRKVTIFTFYSLIWIEEETGDGLYFNSGGDEETLKWLSV